MLTAPYDWKRSEGTVFEPDLLVFRSEDFQPDGWLTATPSTTMTHRTLGRAVYQEAGLPSYWLIDSVVPSLTMLELEGGAHREGAAVSGKQPFSAARPFPVTVVPAALTR